MHARFAAVAIGLWSLCWPCPPSRGADTPDEKTAALVKDLSAEDDSTRLNAALALGKLGKPAVEPVAALLRDRDADTRYYAVWALGLIGPDARGHTADVVKLLADKNEQVRRKAAIALERIAEKPEDALPQLVKAMSDDSPEVRAAAADAAAWFGGRAVPFLLGALKSSEGRVRGAAAHALGGIGPEAAEALPALSALLRDDDARIVTEAVEALGKLGNVSLPVLAQALASDSRLVRRRAVEAIAQVGGDDAVTILVGGLKVAAPDVRHAAARQLGLLRAVSPEAVLALADVLTKDEDGEARYQAIRALERLGGPAAAVPAIAQALGDREYDVRRKAFIALAGLGIDPNTAVREVFKRDDVRARICAASLILAENRDHAEAAKILTEGLREGDAALRFEAAFGLADAQLAPGETVGVLTEALSDKDPRIRRQGVQGLGIVGKQGDKPIAEALTLALKDENAEVRHLAATSLASLRAPAKVVMPVLAEMVKDKFFMTRGAALRSMKHYPDEAWPYFVEALKDEDRSLRMSAAIILDKTGAGGEKSIAALAEAAKNDPDHDVRVQAAWAVINRGEAAIPAMIDLLKSKDAAVLESVMESLQRHRGKAKGAAPALIDVLQNGGDHLRAQAAQTLGQIGPDAGVAVDALKEATAKDPNPEVRRQAVLALRLIQKD